MSELTSSEKKMLRKHIFVDPKVQGALVGRVILYWVVCLLTITLMLLCWRIVTGPARMFYTHFDDMWFHFGPALVASLVILPLVAVDIVRLSNRFVGPMLRMRRAMRELADGQPVAPLEFRDSDFWRDFAQEFNAVAKRVEQLETKAARRAASSESTPPRAQTFDDERELVAAWHTE